MKNTIKINEIWKYRETLTKRYINIIKVSGKESWSAEQTIGEISALDSMMFSFGYAADTMKNRYVLHNLVWNKETKEYERKIK